MRVRFSPWLLGLWAAVLPGCPEARAPEAGEDRLALPCGPDTVTKSVGWNEQTELGVTPREAFGRALACEARGRWDARWYRDAQVEPIRGDTSLALLATPVENTVELVSTKAGSPVTCPPFLRVRADVRVETADGSLGGSARSELLYRPGGPVQASFGIPIDRAATTGLRVDDPRDYSVGYVGEWHEHGCQGFINLNTSAGLHQVSYGLGDWSSTRCLGRGAPVPLEDAELSVDIDALLESFDGSFAGQWQDGQPAALEMHVARDGPFVCKRELQPGAAVVVPVKLRYSTTDGRIAEHEADAYLGLARGTRLPSLSVTEHFVCDDAKDALAYTPCNELFHALLSLALTHDMGEVWSAGPALTIYEYKGHEFDPSQTLAFELRPD